MKLRHELFLTCVLSLVATLSLAIFPAVPAFAQVTPAAVSSSGYINTTPLTTQTTAEFNSIGSTTLVAFVSSHPVWPQPGPGLPVSIGGVTDNMGNTWNVLTGPTQWVGSVYTQLSAIYYVNAPVTSATHTVTVNLTNPAPLVVDVFAVSNSDITAPPIFSAISNPGTGGTDATVATASITVPSTSLLLSWVKNETSATATAEDGYTLDPSSTSFLWAETQTAPSTGSYMGQFEYNEDIGWQTAIVGLQPLAVPVAYSEGVSTGQNKPVTITLTALSPQGFGLTYAELTLPTQGTLTGTPPNLTYTPNTGYVGPDMFTFKANDGTKDTNVATIPITVGAPAVINSVAWLNGTAPYTAQTTPPFNSSGATTLVAFVSSYTEWNSNQVMINGVSDNEGNTWTQLTGPAQWIDTANPGLTQLSAIYYVNSPTTSTTHTVTLNLTNAAPSVIHVFAVSGSNTTGAPVTSTITSTGTGGTSALVTTAPITVPSHSLLLSWVKNDSNSIPTPLNATLDVTNSNGFLAAEFEPTLYAGSYTGQFDFSTAIGWQTAIVGIQPATTSWPGIYSPGYNSTLTGTSATFQWYGYTGATAYWLDVGSTQGGNNYYSSGSLSTSTHSQTIYSLPSDGSTVWARWYYKLSGTWQHIDYSYTALGGSAERGVITSPAPSSTLSGSTVTFNWTPGSGASAYWVDIGSSAGGNNYYSSGNLGNVFTVAVNGLPTDGSTVYVTLYSQVGGVWLSSAYTYTAFNAAAAAGILTTPPPGPSTILTGSTVTFDWTAGSPGPYSYWMDIGSSAGGNNYYSSGNLGNVTTTTVYTLPTDGSTVYVTLYTLIGGVWTPKAYTYTALNATSGLAAMTTPAPGSPLVANSVQFKWSADASATAYWIDIGSTAGSNNVWSSGNLGNVFATTDFNVPANGKTIYATLYSLVGGQWKSTSCTYTEALGAVVQSPSPGSTLSGGSATFSWSAAGTGFTSYELTVGSTYGGAQYYNSGTLSGLTTTATGLPTSGSTMVYVTLYSFNTNNGTQLQNYYYYFSGP